MAEAGAANPVGVLYERYQTAGAKMPVYDVAMVAGQAHAPIFRAKLSVAEGVQATADGSSKKIAKNKAAAEVLEILGGAVKKTKKVNEGSGGEELGKLVAAGREGVASLGGFTFLQLLVDEQDMHLKTVEVGRSEERVQWLLQVCKPASCTTVTVCLGTGLTKEEATTSAANTILIYFFTLYKQ